MKSRRLPKRLKWLFLDMNFERIHAVKDADTVIATIVEWGLLEDVQWMLRFYGRDRVHAFFRDGASPKVSDRTVAFWRAALGEADEEWTRATPWRRSSSAPWID